MAVFGKKNLFTQLQFNETVAETVYDNIKELYDDPDQRGAIVKYDDNGRENYVIIAMKADDLMESFGKKFKKNEEVGAFSASINDGLIQAVLVEGDFESGILALIPTVDTLADMTEWSFVEKTLIHLAVVTPEFNAQDGVVLLSDTITVNELKNIKNGHMTVIIKNDENGEPDEAEIVKIEDLEKMSTSESVEDEVFDEDADVEPSYDVDVDVDGDYDYDEDVVDDEIIVDTDEVYDDEPIYDEVPEIYESDVEDAYDYSDDVFMSEPEEYSVEEPQIQSEVVTQEQLDIQNLANVQEILLKQLNSDSLDINITDDEFVKVFAQDAYPIELFNETPADPNNQLDVHVAQMSSLANTKILRFIDEKVSMFASEYLLALRTFADKLTKRLDYHDEETDAGRKFKELKSERARLIEAAVLDHDAKAKDIEADYRERKEKFVKERQLQAEREFDDEHRAQLEKDLEIDVAKIELEGNDFEAKGLQELHGRRRDVAHVFMDRAITDLLIHYRDEMAKVYKQANEIALNESNQINRYIEQNFASEVMRANALQKQMDMQSDLKALQDKFDAQLVEKNAEIQALRDKSDADFTALKEQSTLDIQNIKEELNRELEAERLVNKELRTSLERMTEKFETLDEKKESEYKHRLKVADDRVEALERRLDAREKDIQIGNRNRWIIAVLLALTTAIVGVLVTMAVMNQNQATANNSNQSQITQLKRDLDDAKSDAKAAKTEANNAKSDVNAKQAQIDGLTKVINERNAQNQTPQTPQAQP